MWRCASKSHRPSFGQSVWGMAFGWNAGSTQSYPAQLQDLLRREFLEANFELFNLGVAGYSSFHGLRQLKTRVLDLNPDVVIVALAMNEPHMAGADDKH